MNQWIDVQTVCLASKALQFALLDWFSFSFLLNHHIYRKISYPSSFPQDTCLSCKHRVPLRTWLVFSGPARSEVSVSFHCSPQMAPVFAATCQHSHETVEEGLSILRAKVKSGSTTLPNWNTDCLELAFSFFSFFPSNLSRDSWKEMLTESETKFRAQFNDWISFLPRFIMLRYGYL